MEKHLEELLRINRNSRERRIHAEFRTVEFKDDGFYIAYVPSFNLTGYGDTGEEAMKMLMDIVLKDYFENLLSLPDKQLFDELRQYGWVKKPFLTKQLRNTKFLDSNTIKTSFNLPAETVLHEKYVTA